MDIDTVCKLLISALEDAGYNSSTIFNYQGAVRRFKAFCEERNVTEYSSDVGELYANDVISPKTGKFSKERYHLQGRFIRLIDSYINIFASSNGFLEVYTNVEIPYSSASPSSL